MQFGFYVSGNATRLCNLLKDERSLGKISFVIIDNKNCSHLRELLSERNIPLYEYSYKELNLIGKMQNEFISNEILKMMDLYKTPYLFINGSRILQGKLLEKYAWRLINLHPAVLPAFKGKRAIDKALEEGALLLGNTAHFIDSELDAGKMIMQSLFPAYKFTDYEEVLNLQIPMVLSIMKWLDENRIHIKKNRVIVEGANYSIGQFIPDIEI